MNGGGRRRGDPLLSHLSRRTTGGRLIPEVDGLRFLAIALVLAAHVAVAVSLATHQSAVVAPFGQPSPRAHVDTVTAIFQQGAVGVQVFFMVSGFVLALPFIRSRSSTGGPVDLGRYFRRRVTRIEPPYLLVMTLLFAGSWLAGLHVGFGHLIASLAYVHGAYYDSFSPLNTVAWSLEVEVQFYVLVPALALLLCAGRRSIRRQTILLFACLAIALQVSGLITSFAFLASYLQFFLMGWLLADIYIDDWGEAPTSSRAWDVVGFGALAVLLIGFTHTSVAVEHALAPWVIFALGWSALRGKSFRRMLSNRWIAAIGGMCYSIYLIHYPLFILMSRSLAPIGRLAPPAALVLAAIALVPFAIGVSAIFFVTVERPCMDPTWPERASGWIRGTSHRLRRSDKDIIVIPESLSMSDETVRVAAADPGRPDASRVVASLPPERAPAESAEPASLVS